MRAGVSKSSTSSGWPGACGPNFRAPPDNATVSNRPRVMHRFIHIPSGTEAGARGFRSGRKKVRTRFVFSHQIRNAPSAPSITSIGFDTSVSFQYTNSSMASTDDQIDSILAQLQPRQ
jgi:hypothetical protein